MPDSRDSLTVEITPADPAPQDQSPLSVKDVAAYPNMPGFDVDEQSRALVIKGLDHDGGGDVRLLDEGGRIVMRGRYDHNLTVNLVLFRLLEMKGWKRIALDGNAAFCRELAWKALDWDVQVSDAELAAYVSERKQRERRRELLTATMVYLLFGGLALVVPALVFVGLGNLSSLIADNIGYALAALVGIVFLLRGMSRWITGGA